MIAIFFLGNVSVDQPSGNAPKIRENWYIDEDKIHAKIQQKKKQPKKQNRFQRKMAEMMEQAEEQKKAQQKRK